MTYECGLAHEIVTEPVAYCRSDEIWKSARASFRTGPADCTTAEKGEKFSSRVEAEHSQKI